ncbi:MAG: biotin--[acetyl-CoA-carboxylase] ligase [Spirochaetes bacterium GWF1_31_7]|nr:MAG: biotin--[acetyl-CoA-carboxylase] ligase [Spirochaetes bacterium GWE1_32_154]OHD47993.1 MAG: biotin--[acetyl-CoA-carboxylase] ligase [Spirochaetes bacterium GWF1_31_7]OHD48084.1 MAG: biotin--[acetyl-CoA-carboxylase] ligase [Spirochaetes bacterium GWE2_31_10]HBD92796.1 biotin--[acetyl-CoA-carboxylase] ligase [Spirochaetia bacterium]HBI36418.1 biotin--[acetyl-CoA-carboxylase] ligase [Spirochaetia bacterium]
MQKLLNSIIYLSSTDSTNSQLLNNEHPHLTVLYTFNQTAGRGRLDRTWETPADKNIALSVLFSPPRISSTWLTAILSISLIDTFLYHKIENSWIKWPNDVFIEKNKIAGVLTESQWQNSSIKKSVTGIGININSTYDDLKHINRPVTSLYIETGKTFDLHNFLTKYIEIIEKYLRITEKDSINIIKEKWISYSKVIGMKASLTEITKGSTPIYGIVHHIDDEGYLYFNDGKTIFKVVTGDINIL